MSESVTQNELNALQIAILPITDVHQTCHEGRFPGDVVTYCFWWRSKIFPSPMYPPKPLFGENLQLKKPMESVSAYFLTTDKAIFTKRDQSIKKIELYKKLEFGDKGGLTRVT